MNDRPAISRNYAYAFVLPCFALTAMALPVAAVSAQEVVQPLPPAGVSDLNAALRVLARNANDVDALIDAGNASLSVNDIDAAIGFFGRAEELSPGNSRIKLGLALAYIRKQRPIDALRLFEEAEAAGLSTLALAGDRGLAYDLVGDNASAQRQYRSALSNPGLSPVEQAELRQRLAFSHAIAGDRAGFETALAPLLGQNSPMAFRVRAFALAILGDADGAVTIARQAMPQGQSARIAPYLRYMPRLTRAQQAAAANLGVFPEASQIGRDTPLVAQYAGSRGTAASSSAPMPAAAGANLAPQGPPLGQAPAAQSETSASVRVGQAAPDTRPRSERRSRREPGVSRTASDVLYRARATRQQRASRAENTPAATGAPPAAPLTRPSTIPSATAAQSAPATSQVPSIAVRTTGELPAIATRKVEDAIPQSTSIVPSPGEAPAIVAATIPAAAQATASEPAPVTVIRTTQPVVQDVPASVASAFADLDLTANAGRTATPSAVDISAIRPPREKPAPPEAMAAPIEEAKPAPPVNPRRFWAQVATGRDRDALAFDWRRIQRRSADILNGKNGFVAKWGGTNRLLAGPFDSSRAANQAVAALKEAGIDSFAFTSAAGEAVDPLE